MEEQTVDSDAVADSGAVSTYIPRDPSVVRATARAHVDRGPYTTGGLCSSKYENKKVTVRPYSVVYSQTQ